jgi:hypothetical protein
MRPAFAGGLRHGTGMVHARGGPRRIIAKLAELAELGTPPDEHLKAIGLKNLHYRLQGG